MKRVKSASESEGSLFSSMFSGRKKKKVDEEVVAREGKLHLVVLVHGLWGSASDFDNFKRILVEKDEKRNELVVVAVSKNFSTMDGVKNGAVRSFQEVKEVVGRHGGIERFDLVSLIGHSLGGLYARYLAFLMNEDGMLDELQPCVFATFATPHLGVRRPPTTPFNLLWNTIVLPLFRTTKELGLIDQNHVDPDTGEKLSVLHAMGTQECFLIPLKKFKRRVLYSNVKWDFQVPYTTSAIRYRNPYKSRGKPDPEPVIKDKDGKCFPIAKIPRTASTKPHSMLRDFTDWSLTHWSKRMHWESSSVVEHGVIRSIVKQPELVKDIVAESMLHQMSPEPRSFEEAFQKDKMREKLREMMFNLDARLGDWERYDCSFLGWFAHEQIIGKRGFLPGKSVVVHFYDQILRPTHEECSDTTSKQDALLLEES